MKAILDEGDINNTKIVKKSNFFSGGGLRKNLISQEWINIF